MDVFYDNRFLAVVISSVIVTQVVMGVLVICDKVRRMRKIDWIFNRRS